MLAYSIELSLNLLIKVIATVNFQHDQCIAHYSPNPRSISPLSDSFPVVLNDYQCKHGCRQYIVENPLKYIPNNKRGQINFNPFKTCMVQQRNSDMKAIIILNTKSLQAYLNNPGNFGINVVIIMSNDKYFYIFGHTDLARKKLVVLNRWEIIKTRFTNEPGSVGIDGFFDDRWTKYPNAAIKLQIHAYYPFKIITNSGYLHGVDSYIIEHFATYLKVLLHPEVINEDFIAIANEKGAFLLADRTSNQAQFPQTYPATIFSQVFVVPKPG